MFVTELSDSETNANLWFFMVAHGSLIYFNADSYLYLVFFARICIQRWALAAR